MQLTYGIGNNLINNLEQTIFIMTDQDLKLQERLRKLQLIEEARLTFEKLYKSGHLSIGAGGLRVADASDNLYVVSDYCDNYFE